LTLIFEAAYKNFADDFFEGLKFHRKKMRGSKKSRKGSGTDLYRWRLNIIGKQIFRPRRKPKRSEKRQIRLSNEDLFTAKQCAAQAGEPLAALLWRIIHEAMGRARERWEWNRKASLSEALFYVDDFRQMFTAEAPVFQSPADEVLCDFRHRLGKIMDDWAAQRFLAEPHPDLGGKISIHEAISRQHRFRECEKIIRRYERDCRRLTPTANS
jgi:hypothetical protein